LIFMNARWSLGQLARELRVTEERAVEIDRSMRSKVFPDGRESD